MFRWIVLGISRLWEQIVTSPKKATPDPGSEESEESEEESGPVYFTREEALAIAAGKRASDVTESDGLISYVTFVEGMDDYCRVEFRRELPDGWTQTMRMLPNEERSPEQQITDERIAKVARAGRIISAIRLHRGKYGTSLQEARSAVEQMLK